MSEDSSVSSSQTDGSTTRLSGWALVAFGVVLAALLAVCGATLYLVTQIEDQNAQVEETAKTVKATKALLGVVAARQLESKDALAQVEAGVAGLESLLNETQATLDRTNQTLDEIDALLAHVDAASAKLQASVDDLQQGQQQLSKGLEQGLSKIQARQAAIESRLSRR